MTSDRSWMLEPTGAHAFSRAIRVIFCAVSRPGARHTPSSAAPAGSSATSTEGVAIMRALFETADPQRILNPGKTLG